MPLGKNSIGSYLIGSSYNIFDGTIKSNFKARSSSSSSLSTGIILSSAFKASSSFNSDLTTGILLKSRFKARSIVTAALSTLTNYVTLSVGNEKEGYKLEQDVRTHFNNTVFPALFYITDLQNNLVSFPEITGLFLKGSEQGQFIIKTIDELIRLTSSINRTATLSDTLFLIEIKLIKSGYYIEIPPIIDTLPPVLTLNGGDLTIIEGTPYIELGANAIDNIDGVVSVSINGNVNVNKTGAYQLTYTASDRAGNISVKNRLVTVIAKASISNYEASGSNANNELLIIDNTDKYIPSNIFGKDDFIKIESSVDFSVAIKLDGTLWSIGANDVGQCGLGHTNKVTSLTQITANVQTIKFIDVSLGKHHVLALSSSHILYAWGGNEVGQVGTGDFNNQPVPIVISIGYKQISAGFYHSIAIDSDNAMTGWGSNYYGQILTGDRTPVTRPTKIINSFNKISVGENFAITINNRNELLGIGSGSNGQLNYDNTVTPHGNYTFFALDSPILTAIAGRRFTIALKNNLAFGTGQNTYGQVGANIGVDTVSFTQLSTINFVELFAGVEHWFGLDSNNALYGMGRNSHRQLGVGDTIDKTVPTLVSAPLNGGVWVKVNGGYKHSLAISSLGDLYVTGSAANATTFPTTSKAVFTQIGAIGGWTDISAGREHSLAIRNGKVYAWGNNLSGECSNIIASTGTNIITEIMQGITANEAAISVHAGAFISFVIMSSGTVYSFGSNLVYNSTVECGKLGRVINGTSDAVPTAIDGFYLDLSVSYDSIYALTRNRQLTSWGYNRNFQLSTGRIYSTVVGQTTYGENQFKPLIAVSDFNVLAISAGIYHTTLIKYINIGDAFGSLWGCGNNSRKQVYKAITKEERSLVRIGSKIDFTSVSSSLHNVAIDLTGIVYTWGYDYFGQLGLSINSDVSSPTKVDNNIYKTGKAGYHHTVLLRSDNKAVVCGQNIYGQLGLSISQAEKTTPTEQYKDKLKTVAINTVNFAFFDGNKLLIEGNTVLCSGANEWGQLGIGYFYDLNDGTIAFSSVLGQYESVHTYSSENTLGTVTNNYQVALPTNAVKVGLGFSHSVYLDTTGDLYGAGDNTYLQIANAVGGKVIAGTNEPNTITHSVIDVNQYDTIDKTGRKYTDFACGYYSTLAVSTTGELFGSGLNATPSQGANVKIGTAANWVKVFAKGAQLAAINTLNELYVWGWGSDGQLGLGDTASQDYPTKTALLAVKISQSRRTSFAITTSGELYGTGQNSVGQLGLGYSSTILTSLFSKIGTDTDWIDVVNSENITLALKSNGTLWICGDLGTEYVGDRTLLQNSIIGNKFSELFSDGHLFYVKKQDGTLWFFDKLSVTKGVSVNSLTQVSNTSYTDINAGYFNTFYKK